MKNIVILTHGNFSKGIAQSLQFILGDVKHLKTMSIKLEDSMESTINELKLIIESFKNELPTILITDIPGGSTTQAAIKIINDYDNLYVVTGLNLGLLMGLAMLEMTKSKEENCKMIKDIIEQSKETITLINDVTFCANELSDDGEL